MKTRILIIIISLLTSSSFLKAQTSDELFKNARKAAFDLKDYDKAKQLASRALKRSPDYAEIEIFLGRVYTWEKQYDSARYHFLKVLRKNPKNVDASIAYTDLEYWNDNYEEALNICNRALFAHPTSDALLIRKAKILNATKRPVEANFISNLLFQNNDQNFSDSPFLSSSSFLKDKTSDELFKNAREAAFDLRDYDKAIQLALRSLQISPAYAEVEIFLGRVYTWDKQYDMARYHFLKVLRTDKKNEDASIAYTDLEYWNDNYKEALSICNRALAIYPASEALLIRKAKILNVTKKMEEASMLTKQPLKNNNQDLPDSPFLSSSSLVKAQTSDELFKNSREAAFDLKDYDKAEQFALLALQISPSYADVEIFLGRVYTWDDQYDSARYHFLKVLGTTPINEDASIAYADLEYGNDNYKEALNICNRALAVYPASQALLLRKAKVLNAIKKPAEASMITAQLLKNNDHDSAALDLAATIKDASKVNILSVSYDNSSFDKQYDKAWQFSSISYGRYTKFGTVIGRLNYANRFGENGVQGEIDAYPHISKTFYSYLNFGYSNNAGVFPNYRAGFSLYANLPKSFEAEAGMRYLYFTSATYIYTFYIGKYYKNFLFSARTYLTPSDAGISQSYNLAARYFFGGADNYVGVSAGKGLSPDETNQVILLTNKINFSSKQVSARFSHTFLKWNVILLSAGLINQEYGPAVYGNEFDFSIKLSHRF
jgi:YaiO family outer membrane protein